MTESEVRVIVGLISSADDPHVRNRVDYLFRQFVGAYPEHRSFALDYLRSIRPLPTVTDDPLVTPYLGYPGRRRW